ncbi:MAG: ATP-binding cassette domain-containing protein [Candidatus Omnitrophota bacterium]|jgi:ABC-type polysaccharide/polyol phosphate transport system ATPase subunit
MITLSNVSKKFTFYSKGRSLLSRAVTGAMRKKKAPEIICALNDINIDIKKGEIVGLIGANGSGKSTLLKIISGIYKPTTGAIRISGDITALLQSGDIFSPDLSVRDNIFLYGAIMGLDRKDVRKRLKKIIDFAGVGDFVDSEARILSLGMEERLAFSIVIQASRDILLFDEIFATGDRNFTSEGFKVIEEFKKMKKTIVISSHDLDIVRRLCDRVILLDKGRVAAFEHTGAAIDKYISLVKDSRRE